MATRGSVASSPGQRNSVRRSMADADPSGASPADGQAHSQISEVEPGGGAAPMTAFLIEVAEVETRLRQHILELIEPSIRKQGILEGRLREVKAYIGNTKDEVEDLKKISSGAEGIYSMVESFRVEMSSWDKQRHEHEAKVGDRLSMQETEINALRQSLEVLKGADHGSSSRTLKNFGDMLAAYKDENTDLRRFCLERIDLNRDKLAKLRDEFETRTMILENQMHHLQDMQTTTNTKVAHVEEIVSRMDRRVDESANGIADLWRSKASVTCVEEQQLDLTEFMRHVNSVVSSLKQQFGSLVDDVKGHFQTATQIVGKSTAQQMDTIRGQYEEDIHRIDTVRREIEEFVQIQSKAHEQLQKDLVDLRKKFFFGGAEEPTAEHSEAAEEPEDTEQPEAAAVKAAAVKASEHPVAAPSKASDAQGMPERMGIVQLHKALERLEKQRDIDSKGLQVEMAGYRKSIHDHEAILSEHSASIKQRKLIVNTLLETAMMGLHLEMQDDQDRKSIALFGVKGGNEKASSNNLPDIANNGRSRPPAIAPSSALKASPRRRLTKGSETTPSPPDGDAGAVLAVDNRCLSCSGNAATVLAGFKMACLQYAPSPVEWEKSSYSRSDLIHKRIQLLQQAKASMSSRPVD